MDTNSKISSRPSECGTVPITQLAFPRCNAMEIAWKRNSVDLFSPVVVVVDPFIYLPKLNFLQFVVLNWSNQSPSRLVNNTLKKNTLEIPNIV